ncbi:MAG TPA: PQQ-dependent sugar dehydrogenase [Gaiellaceae bacterium]|nr:PQQ-dependent sugar dehydrogenase [Gaiellaceae bacterium]
MHRRLILAGVLPLAALAAGLALAARGGPDRAALRLVPVVRGLHEPLHVAAPRSEPRNLYIVEKGGRIRVRVRGHLRARPFLDVSRLVSTGGEQGLLSVAFHPSYGRNRRFYIDYTDRAGDTRVVEYRSRGLSRAPVRVRQILFVNQPYSNHNGGQLAFGPDGYLYVGMGDGGSAGDPENRAQNLGTFLGKLLRINVNLRRPRAQIAAYGLRNPWRFSFDRQTGDLYIGDVGQNAWEEIDFTSRRSPGLENYGWRVYEGNERSTNEEPNPAGRLVFPIVVAPNGPNCSIIGGFVYRGTAVPAARGRYFFGDYCEERIRSVAAPGGMEVRNEPFNVSGLASFGEDARGELYLASLDRGVVYKLARSS